MENEELTTFFNETLNKHQQNIEQVKEIVNDWIFEENKREFVLKVIELSNEMLLTMSKEHKRMIEILTQLSEMNLSDEKIKDLKAEKEELLKNYEKR